MLFLEVVYLLQIVPTEVAPMVIWCTIGVDGQTGFLFVQQHFEKDVLVLGAAAIEHELEIGGHREDVGTPPALALHLFEVVGAQVVAIDAQQAYQRQDDRVVPKA